MSDIANADIMPTFRDVARGPEMVYKWYIKEDWAEE
jgi:hypothetical protein